MEVVLAQGAAEIQVIVPDMFPESSHPFAKPYIPDRVHGKYAQAIGVVFTTGVCVAAVLEIETPEGSITEARFFLVIPRLVVFLDEYVVHGMEAGLTPWSVCVAHA
jgi:hypothetical protein